MLKLVCNTRCLQTKLTGVQRYTLEILKHFPKNEVELVKPPDTIARGALGHLWEQTILPLNIGKSLLWSPSNSGPITLKRQIVTIHDVVPIDHPEWLNPTFAKWYNFLMPRLIKNVEHIITISEFSKQRIVDLYKIPDSKISVIYNGVHTKELLAENNYEKVELPFKRYVLSLGSLEPRKNLPLLFSSWHKALNDIPDDVGLVVVGGIGNKKVFRDTNINSIPDRVLLLGHLSDSKIAYLYRNAMFFVYMSVYEGFGLPPLEAMAAGTPVLTGNRTSLPEVVQDSGMMIDPFSELDCKNALIKLANDEDLRQTLSVKGKLRAEKFDWETSSLSTWNTLEKYL